MDNFPIEHITNAGLACLIGLVGFCLAYFISILVSKLFVRFKLDKTLVTFFSQLLFWLIFTAFLIAALNQSGLYTTSFVTILGGGIAALVLSLQGSLSQIANGFILMGQRRFRVGDTLEVKGVEGTVKDIDLFYTYLDVQGNTAIIPNGDLFTNIVTIKKK